MLLLLLADYILNHVNEAKKEKYTHQLSNKNADSLDTNDDEFDFTFLFCYFWIDAHVVHFSFLLLRSSICVPDLMYYVCMYVLTNRILSVS